MFVIVLISDSGSLYLSTIVVAYSGCGDSIQACGQRWVFVPFSRAAMRFSERAVELGARLVGASPRGTSVVMQMPRGNLEAIHPRIFVVDVIKVLLMCFHVP